MGSLVYVEPCSMAPLCLKYPSLLIAIGRYIIKGWLCSLCVLVRLYVSYTLLYVVKVVYYPYGISWGP